MQFRISLLDDDPVAHRSLAGGDPLIQTLPAELLAEVAAPGHSLPYY